MIKKSKNILCIIPARGGSKGIKRKNLLPLAGKPLIFYQIDAALNSISVNHVLVSTEDQEIADAALDCGAKVPFLRPQHLAEDHIHSVFPVIDMLERCRNEYDYNPDAVMMLLPTSPLTKSQHIDGALRLFFSHQNGGVISVYPFEKPLSSIRKSEGSEMQPVFQVENFNMQRQDMEQFYIVNGSIYIARPDDLIKNKTFHGPVLYPYVMNKHESIDINDEFDIQLVEFIISKKKCHEFTN